MRIETEYLRVIKKRFKDVKSLGDKAIEQLAEEDIHWALNEESNSVAVIVSHLSGNMVSRWGEALKKSGTGVC